MASEHEAGRQTPLGNGFWNGFADQLGLRHLDQSFCRLEMFSMWNALFSALKGFFDHSANVAEQ
jgi:hypothetical protein